MKLSSKKYIIDTDPGHDDAMAIMLAIKSGLDIIAITTVAGNSNIKNTTKNAEYILELLGRQDIPIYSGGDRPLERDLVQAVVHWESGLEGIDPDTEWVLTWDAPEKILEMLRKNDSISIITLGPLTNIAQAILKDPSAFSRLDELIIMGGAIRVPGNKNRVAEFNIFVDPEAADIVFRFPVKKTIVPLDACNAVQMQISDFQKISSSLRASLLDMVWPYIENIGNNEGTYAAFMYDPLTVYYVLYPENCIIEELDVLVETRGELTRWMTVADLRKKWDGINPLSVVNSIEPSKFIADFIRILSL